jgi:hypothetical protein
VQARSLRSLTGRSPVAQVVLVERSSQ